MARIERSEIRETWHSPTLGLLAEPGPEPDQSGAFEVLVTLPIMTKPLAWAAQGVSSAKQVSDHSLQFLADALAWVAGVIQAVWVWSSDQIVRMTQAPWDNWPLWKQILLLIVAAFVVYALFVAFRQLWSASLNLLSAFASFIGTLIVTLPMILLAGAIALASLWVINNYHGMSSLRSIMFQSGDTGSTNGSAATPSGPAAPHGPAEKIGDR